MASLARCLIASYWLMSAEHQHGEKLGQKTLLHQIPVDMETVAYVQFLDLGTGPDRAILSVGHSPDGICLQSQRAVDLMDLPRGAHETRVTPMSH